MKKSRKEKGTNYEKFANNIIMLDSIIWDKKVVFDIYLGNGVIDGISKLNHQIDIHLSSSKYPNYHLLCECKDHKNTIEKSEICAFVTIINDIKKKHKDWKIIPLFLSKSDYQKGAKIMAKYYKIVLFNLEKFKDYNRKLVIEEKVYSPNLEIKKVVLQNGTICKTNILLNNLDNPGQRYPRDILNFYHLYDDNGKEIEDIVYHKGYFKTGKYIRKRNKNDYFYTEIGKKRIKSIEGIVHGYTEKDTNTSEDVFKASAKAVLKIEGGKEYRINNDGTIVGN